MRSSAVLLVALLAGCHPHLDVAGYFMIPGLPDKQFVQQGDIQIGALLPMTSFTAEGLCSDKPTRSVYFPEVIKYAVDRFNQDHGLPLNLTLGFVVLDDCLGVNAATAQALAFVPQDTCSANVANVQRPFDVVAAIGSTTSSMSIAVSHVLGPALVPLVSVSATSDDLSDKILFPYFLRTTSPDRFQFVAICSFIAMHAWSYVSVLYKEGSYGENGFKQLRNCLDSKHICLAVVHKISTTFPDDEAVAIAEMLATHYQARVVVAITSMGGNGALLIKTVASLVPAGSIVWLGADSWSGIAKTFVHPSREHLLGSFVFSPLAAYVDDFDDYFLQLVPEKTEYNPWFELFWESQFNCSLNSGTCDPTLRLNQTMNRTSSTVGIVIDTVNMVANATARVLQRPECQATGDASQARACVTGPKLLQELKSTGQNGYTGWLQLDSNGDRRVHYDITQLMPSDVILSDGRPKLDMVKVADYDSLTGKLRLIKNVTWRYHQKHDVGVDFEEDNTKSPNKGDVSNLSHPVPDSRCSYPCGPHQALVLQEVACCWLCQPCRVNEFLVTTVHRSSTRCQPCPLHTWPDPESDYTVCMDILPTRLRIDTITGAAQALIAILGLLASLVVFVFFHRHRRCRVIKASSRELSFLMLLAISLGYLVMLTLLAPPTDFTCQFNFMLFCVTFTLIYGPLLIRALRIFRIFEASKSSARRPKMIDSSHQLIFSCSLVFVQVLMCVVVMAVHGPWHKKTQPSLQREYVELTCDVPLWGLASFLAYNLLLVTVCTLLAFKTRRLPDNFNESRFISMCVSTTLVILLCFIPAYLVSGSELLKMLMLALAAALNHSVALVFLFVPKIYAVLYLEGASDIARTTMQGNGTVSGTRHTSGASRFHGGEISTGVATVSSGFGVDQGIEDGLPGSEQRARGSHDSVCTSLNYRQIHPAS